VKVVNQSEVPRIGRIDFLFIVSTRLCPVYKILRTLSVAIFIHSSKFASRGMTRFIGVTAVPVTSGMGSWLFDGVCGLFCAASDMRRRFGVADALMESLWASWRA